MRSGLYNGQLFLAHKHAQGGLWITPGVRDFNKQIYTFKAPDRPEIHFNIRGLLDAIAGQKGVFHFTETRTIGLPWHSLAHIRKHNGIEEDGVVRVVHENRLHEPGLIADFGETQIIIDGSHRALARGIHGLDFMEMRWLSKTQWRRGLLDIPPEIKVGMI